MEENPEQPSASIESTESIAPSEPIAVQKPRKASGAGKAGKTRKTRKARPARKRSALTALTPPRKRRADAKLGGQSLEIQAQVAEWCMQGTLEAVVVRCANELDPQVIISRGQLSRWYAQWREEQPVRERKVDLMDLFQRADANARAVAQILLERGANEEQIARANHFVFTLQASEQEDIGLYIDLEKLRLSREAADQRARMDAARVEQKQAELGLAERRVSVLEAKLQEIHEATENRTLTAEERAQRIAEIYGRA